MRRGALGIGEELPAFPQALGVQVAPARAGGVAEHAHPHVVHELPAGLVVDDAQQLPCELSSVVDDGVCLFIFEAACLLLDLV